MVLTAHAGVFNVRLRFQCLRYLWPNTSSAKRLCPALLHSIVNTSTALWTPETDWTLLIAYRTAWNKLKWVCFTFCQTGPVMLFAIVSFWLQLRSLYIVCISNTFTWNMIISLAHQETGKNSPIIFSLSRLVSKVNQLLWSLQLFIWAFNNSVGGNTKW